MAALRDWLRKSRFQVYGIAFVLMVLAPVPMVLAAQSGAVAWIWIFFSLFIFANLLVLV